MKGTAWTSLEEKTIREMRAKGATAEQIAASLGRSLNSVKGHIDYMIRRKGDFPIVYHSWTAEDICTVKEMYRTGSSAKEIAAVIGCTANAVYAKIQTLKQREESCDRPQRK